MRIEWIEEAVMMDQDSRAHANKRRRNASREYSAPTTKMNDGTALWNATFEASVSPMSDLVLSMAAVFEKADNARDRFRWAFRDALDDLLDGQRTGRWAYQQLTKTEKTALGTAVEINLTKEFDFQEGARLDWRIAGREIDCKFSKDLGGWLIPQEMYVCADHKRSAPADYPALLTWFDDDRGEWAAGLFIASDERLRWKIDETGQRVRSYNGDKKRPLDNSSVQHIHWLWGGKQQDLPANRLRQLGDGQRERIFENLKSGQARVNQLFREVQEQIVDRTAVLTVAQQDDAPKRARDARLGLRAEGLLVLGHQAHHREIAEHLELPVAAKGQWVSVRVVPVAVSDPRRTFELDGQRWAKARPDEPFALAPKFPKPATRSE